MNKYITPTMEILDFQSNDIVALSEEASALVVYESLPGVDEGDSKSAVFNVNLWM